MYIYNLIKLYIYNLIKTFRGNYSIIVLTVILLFLNNFIFIYFNKVFSDYFLIRYISLKSIEEFLRFLLNILPSTVSYKETS